MRAELYTITDDHRKMVKILKNQKVYEIKLTKDTDILNPVILLSDYDMSHNYIYIENFKRYYYIDNVTIIRDNLYQLSCGVDVLMSYADKVRAMTLQVNRQEFVRQPYIIDNEIVTRSDKDIVTFNVGSVGDSTSTFPYYLVTTGGGVVQ